MQLHRSPDAGGKGSQTGTPEPIQVHHTERRLKRRTHSHHHHHHHHQSLTPRRNTAAATKSVIIVRPLPLLPWQVNHLRTGKGGSSNNNPHGNTQADSVGQSACLAFSSLFPRKSPDTLRYIPHPTFQRQCRPAPPNTCFQLGPLHPLCFLPLPPHLPPFALLEEEEEEGGGGGRRGGGGEGKEGGGKVEGGGR